MTLGQEGFELLPDRLLLMYGLSAGTESILLLLGKLGELPE
jgi:hypothetical protein